VASSTERELRLVAPVNRAGVWTIDKARITRFVRLHIGERLECVIRIEPRKPTRKQRGYYFPIVCGRYGEFAGMTKNEAHYAFKRALLPLEHPDLPLPKVGSIKALSPPRFLDYVDDCRRIAAQMGCDIPDPDPTWRASGYLTELRGAE
jgi:hypothetical protein